MTAFTNAPQNLGAQTTELYSSRIDLPSKNRTQIVALFNHTHAFTLDLKS